MILCSGCLNLLIRCTELNGVNEHTNRMQEMLATLDLQRELLSAVQGTRDDLRL